MNKQKLISVLQSRIAKRRQAIKSGWECYYQHNPENYKLTSFKEFAIEVGLEQKEDKQILKQLVEDERELKKWKTRFDTSSKALGIIAGMREG